MAGLLNKRGSRAGMGEFQSSSMADIAFLLLIFFLVTTTINVDTGIGMTLPPIPDTETPPPEIPDRNILAILVNAQGQLLVEDEPLAVSQLRQMVRTHVLNRGQSPEYSDEPDDAVVSIKTSSQTPYDAYIAVLDEVWMAYFEMWDSEARSLGFASYEAYRDRFSGEENEVREVIPAQISIAEPDPAEGE